MIDAYLLLHSITPSITSLACTRVFLALRGSYLHSGTDHSHHDPGDDRKDYHGGLRRCDDRNLSLDFFVSNPGGTTAQSTSEGVYDITTFTVGMEVNLVVGFTGSPSGQSAYGASTSKPGSATFLA